MDAGYEDFFIEDEKKFRIDDVLGYINRIKKYAKLIGRGGRVHIIDKNTSGTMKLKLLLATRFLGAKLGELEPELKIPKAISEVGIGEIADFLGVEDYNARSRMSQLVDEGFARRPKKGVVEIEPFKIDDFIQSLESGNIKESKEKPNAQHREKHNKVPTKITQRKLIEDENKFFSLISKNLGVDEQKLRDAIFVMDNGSLKYHAVPGKSKGAQQKAVILSAAYLLLIGLGHRTFKTTTMTKVCYNSAVDASDIKYAIVDLKKTGLIGKAGAKSQENILRESGKADAKKILMEMCQ